ncbi:hypothetical protein [Lactobacillus sp. HT06-2]|uniref:hypothetical protein n=1 Tax=Lactobacillus sp. HT06-2 TaxID=2080222 RepID=UPI000CD88C6F|nr:hypothetical protein [Lactobacillus sp. HT06-2]
MKKYDFIDYVAKNIKVQHSELLHDDNIFGGHKVLVFFTNTKTGAKGEAELPTYRWLNKGDLSNEDIDFCNKVLHWNVGNLFQYAREGGVHLE